MSNDDARATSRPSQRRIRAVRREGTKVRFLELFFDLVFVLVFTQCTAFIVHHPTWEGLVQAMFVLALLWWSWGGYAWLTSVIDPEEGPVRLVMFGAMAAVLVVALTVPDAFGDLGLAFAFAYTVLRLLHLALFVLASEGEPNLRHSVMTLTASTAIGLGLLTGAYFLDGVPQLALWAVAILIDFGGPAIFGVEGWKLAPAHFAERFGLIIILALGESIVVLGVSAGEFGFGVAIAVVLGIALSSALWWTYFDVVAIVTEQRLTSATPGRHQNAFARDSYGYLHLPMAAGIVLVAVGLENTVAHVQDPLHTIPAFALNGGVALYLLGHVALRLRNAGTISYPRVTLAAALFALVQLATEVPAWETLLGVNVLIWTLIGYETRMYGEGRVRLRTSH